ncbi:hypothetical protein FNV43_RR16160 [Rhamnella rubrinervis]|uniref:Vacuolar iron transporter n=1 Tax=Rhamnella rubrinervis TaxID=2594499 RepID=A0A8K0EAA2_9ROSA|nr:hypothetical protein FNV43_RR16160 [Rhamnella rubrinervis]
MAAESSEFTTTTRLIIQTENGDKEGQQRRPKEPWKGEYVKCMVYGELDAIITCFSLISSLSASKRSSVDVSVLGFANLVADGMSMGLGDYVVTSTQEDVAAEERAVTGWDVRNQSGPQQTRLLHRYQALVMDINDATTVVNIFAKYRDILVDEKLIAEKGIIPPDEAEKPWKNGLFIGACVLFTLALALLGMAKAKIGAQNYAFSVIFTLFNGANAAAAAYILSWALKSVAGVQD